jgi:hypothetical protein
MPAAPTAPVLLADLTRRGFVIRVTGGALAISPASELTANDRVAVRECRAALLLALSSAESWDAADAIQQMYDADTLVGQLGVSGCHPEVQDAATRVIAAFTDCNPVAFRSALAEFTATVRRLADESGRVGDKLLQQTRR